MVEKSSTPSWKKRASPIKRNAKTPHKENVHEEIHSEKSKHTITVWATVIVFVIAILLIVYGATKWRKGDIYTVQAPGIVTGGGTCTQNSDGSWNCSDVNVSYPLPENTYSSTIRGKFLIEPYIGELIPLYYDRDNPTDVSRFPDENVFEGKLLVSFGIGLICLYLLVLFVNRMRS